MLACMSSSVCVSVACVTVNYCLFKESGIFAAVAAFADVAAARAYFQLALDLAVSFFGRCYC